jgi:hypothetical protein
MLAKNIKFVNPEKNASHFSGVYNEMAKPFFVAQPRKIT